MLSNTVLKIKMFAEGWVVYPRTSGSPEPTWHEARSAECQVGSGDPRGLGYTTQPSANILIFIIAHVLQSKVCQTSKHHRAPASQPTVHELVQVKTSQSPVGGSRRGPSYADWEFVERIHLRGLLINYDGISDIIQIAFELTHDVKHCIFLPSKCFSNELMER